MKKVKIIKIFLIFLTATMTELTANENVQSKWENEFNNLIKKSGHEKNNLGLIVEDGDNIIFEHNVNKAFVPASLTKLVTAGALLKYVPLNTKFKTNLKSAAAINNGVLEGDICFEGGGDPSFVSEKMWYLVNELTRSKLQKINGNMIVDGSRFDQEIFDSGRDSVRVDRAYDAPISALSFNWNTVNVFVRPGSVGKNAQIIVDPENSPVTIVNQTKTVSKGLVKAIHVERKTIKNNKDKKNPWSDTIIVSGNIGSETPELVFYKSISNPEMWSAVHLINFLKQRGIQLSGEIKSGVCSEKSVLLAESPSKNYSEMLADMLKFSNNFVAEMLVKNLGSHLGKKPASMTDGIEILKKYLDELNVTRDSYTLVNVSGLSRENRFSVFQLNKVLKHSLNNFEVYPEFVSGLAISGVDGTLKSRFKNMENPPKIRAKTGYLDGVVGLSGYLEQKGKQPLVFTFIYNGGYEKALAARDLFDDFLIALNKNNR